MTMYTIDNLFCSWTRENVHDCIKAGIDINSLNEDGRNALFFCNHVDAVKAMIEAGIEINLTDRYGNNALFCNTNPKILELLIHSGINIQHKNNKGQSCLHPKSNDIKCAEILFNSGVDIHSIDNKGQTVLYNLYSEDTFDYWIEKGCNINHTHHNGKSVLDLSVDNGKWHYKSNVSALIRHIEKIDSIPVLIRQLGDDHPEPGLRRRDRGRRADGDRRYADHRFGGRRLDAGLAHDRPHGDAVRRAGPLAAGESGKRGAGQHYAVTYREPARGDADPPGRAARSLPVRAGAVSLSPGGSAHGATHQPSGDQAR